MKRDPRPKVLLWCDYGSEGLWIRRRHLLAVSPRHYPLSDELRQDILTWAEWHDSHSPDGGWPRDERAKFVLEGIALWRRMTVEIGDEYRVGYWELGGNRPLWDLDDPKVAEFEERAARL